LTRRRLPALLAATLLLVAFAAPAAARDDARARHDRIVAHWTAARMAAATPRDFSLDPGRGFVPNRPPGSGGGVVGASWTGGGQILQASGKVYFEMGGGAYVCSGAAANDGRAGYSLVLTAAHCAFDESTGKFATNWLFIPNFDGSPTFTCAQTIHGCWTAQALVVHEGYATAGGFNAQATLHDFAFAVVGPGGKSGSAQLDGTVGSFPITFSAFPDGTQMYAFGYPAAGRYKGKDLTYCAGPVFSDPYNDELTYGMTCNMTGGSSGGPWLSSFTSSTGSGTLSSVNSYGYSGVKAMHGPKFDSNTADVYTSANSATTNTIVP
jgi:hypothetical protein